MILFSLAWKSLNNRKFTTILTVISIALSVGLLVGVERVRQGARESFSNTISQTDLIVGAKGGTVQLLLYSVFRIGSATNNIGYDTYLHFKNHAAVKWTIPYSLGDSHRGFRVVGTTEDFYKEFRYHTDRSIELAEGAPALGLFDVALGSEVANKLNYKLGDKVVLTHGVSESIGIINHTDKPFSVVGILKKTNTPVDRSVYITLQGMEAIHMDWQDGAAPLKGHEIPAASLNKDDIKINQITSFLLRTKNRIETLSLQREINIYADEPLMAIIPGVTLNELWTAVSYAETGLRVVAFFVVVVGFLGMLISLYTSLNERRREMAILRAVGAGPKTVVGLLVLESGLLGIFGALAGVMLVLALLELTQPLLESEFGLRLPLNAPTELELFYLVGVVAAGFLIGLVPAIKAYRNSLVDGLTIRV